MATDYVFQIKRDALDESLKRQINWVLVWRELNRTHSSDEQLNVAVMYTQINARQLIASRCI